ncbi:MAG: 23S rRNA pseudouridine(1911/1915/1917) synthase RluD [Gammaproteobacteria bacterium]
MTQVMHLQARIPDSLAGRRLDQALAELFPEYSRSRLQQWIRSGEARINGGHCKAKALVTGGEEVEIKVVLEDQVECRPQPIPLQIIYDDDQLLVIDKPAGLVVHPAAGNPDGTLQNALLHLDSQLAVLPRAGIIHRLDKWTSGLLVVARNLKAHKFLVDELQARDILREYETVVAGVMTAGGTVDAPVGRHPVDRKRMAVVAKGKPSVTHYRVLERYRGHTRVRVQLETGRTHQIRVHMAHIGFPIVGDQVYSGRLRIPKGAGAELADILRNLKRQALHATRLGLRHPGSGEPMQWRVSLPEDLASLVTALRADAAAE